MRRALFVVLAAIVLAAAAAADVQSVADLRASAKEGQNVTVEGRITDVGTASGSRRLVTLEDDTGTVLIRVPEHLLRHLNGGNDPQVGRRVRVNGKWGHAYLDQDVWGIQAESAERIE
jgi:hypothetical protein